MNSYRRLEIEPEVDRYPINGNGNVMTLNGCADETSTSDHVPIAAIKPDVSSVVEVSLRVDKPFPGPTITYHTLRYYASVGSGCSGRRTYKQILHEPRQGRIVCRL